jgi:hypothetical protein
MLCEGLRGGDGDGLGEERGDAGGGDGVAGVAGEIGLVDGYAVDE